MSGWIKLEKDLLLDPRVKRMARRLESECNATALQAVTLVVGGLAILWMHADAHVRPDDTLDLGAYEIDQLVGVAGFCQVCPDDWLEIIDADRVKLPGFHKHNGTEARKKALTQRRVEKHRNADALQSGNGPALPDQDQDQDLDQTKTKTKTSKKPTARQVAPLAGDMSWFRDFQSIYPKRAGDQGWRKAERSAHARLAERHTAEQMLDGARRYAAYVQADHSERTKFVKQAATFLGPDKHFLEPWDPPPSKADSIVAANIEASQEWLRREDHGS